uniref:Uncharacterized protein n=1 Tax=Arcella intermedia TaxID=1963864 RepID=A0A6B2L7U4_9EUKA
MTEFKKRKRSANIRKKTNNEEGEGQTQQEEANEALESVAKRLRMQKVGLLSGSTKARAAVVAEQFAFASSDSAKPDGELDQLATVFMDKKEGEKEKLEKVDEATGKRIYRGLEAYTKPVIKPRMAGPNKSVDNLRVTCRFDYQPDICKDYKETGYCGYGDSCKFLHDRGDYKTGWQLEAEFEEEQKKKRERAYLLAAGESVPEESENDNPYLIEDKDQLPFACFLCKGTFVKPVVTRCKHYFCESCAAKRYISTPKCGACPENTNGIFNVAYDLIKKLKRREEAKAKVHVKGEGKEDVCGGGAPGPGGPGAGPEGPGEVPEGGETEAGPSEDPHELGEPLQTNDEESFSSVSSE